MFYPKHKRSSSQCTIHITETDGHLLLYVQLLIELSVVNLYYYSCINIKLKMYLGVNRTLCFKDRQVNELCTLAFVLFHGYGCHTNIQTFNPCCS